MGSAVSVMKEVNGPRQQSTIASPKEKSNHVKIGKSERIRASMYFTGWTVAKLKLVCNHWNKWSKGQVKIRNHVWGGVLHLTRSLTLFAILLQGVEGSELSLRVAAWANY